MRDFVFVAFTIMMELYSGSRKPCGVIQPSCRCEASQRTGQFGLHGGRYASSDSCDSRQWSKIGRYEISCLRPRTDRGK